MIGKHPKRWWDIFNNSVVVYFIRFLIIIKFTSDYVFTLASRLSLGKVLLKNFRCYEAIVQAVWLKNTLLELQDDKSTFEQIKISCDNLTMVFYSKNIKRSSGSKCIVVKYLAFRDKDKDGLIVVDHVGSMAMIADPFRKCLAPKVSRCIEK